MTSFTKVWVVVSLIRSGAACGAGPPPCSIIVTVSSPDVLRRLSRKNRARSSTARSEVPPPLDGGLVTKFNRLRWIGTPRRGHDALDRGRRKDDARANTLLRSIAIPARGDELAGTPG